MWRLKARSLFTQRASSFVYSLPSVVHCRHQLKSVLQQINALQLLLELSRRTRRRVAGSVIGLKPRDSMTASHVNMPTDSLYITLRDSGSWVSNFLGFDYKSPHPPSRVSGVVATKFCRNLRDSLNMAYRKPYDGGICFVPHFSWISLEGLGKWFMYEYSIYFVPVTPL